MPIPMTYYINTFTTAMFSRFLNMTFNHVFLKLKHFNFQPTFLICKAMGRLTRSPCYLCIPPNSLQVCVLFIVLFLLMGVFRLYLWWLLSVSCIGFLIDKYIKTKNKKNKQLNSVYSIFQGESPSTLFTDRNTLFCKQWCSTVHPINNDPLEIHTGYLLLNTWLSFCRTAYMMNPYTYFNQTM
jgi:hypothetical protein